jgi:hypothetical protein
LRCDAGEWLDALRDLDQFYGQFGSRLPQSIAQRWRRRAKQFGA